MRWSGEVRIVIASIVGLSAPRRWIKVCRTASGKARQRTSRHFSPPRMPVSQSCTSATRSPAVPGRDARPTRAELPWTLASMPASS